MTVFNMEAENSRKACQSVPAEDARDRRRDDAVKFRFLGDKRFR